MATVRITWQTGLYLLRVRAGGHFEKDYSKKILAAKNILKTGYPPGPNFKITQAPLAKIKVPRCEIFFAQSIPIDLTKTQKTKIWTDLP